VNTTYLPLLNAIGVHDLAGHEGVHLTACTRYIGHTNVKFFDATQAKRVPIIAIRGMVLQLEGQPFNAWEEGAACYLTTCPSYI
jgi:hypothetical protein